MSEQSNDVTPGSRWGLINGGEYVVLHCAMDHETGRSVVVYATDDGKPVGVWTRPFSEFVDGRFVRLPDRLNARERMADLSADAVDRLRRVEWCGGRTTVYDDPEHPTGYVLPECPACGGFDPIDQVARKFGGAKHQGHRPDCPIAAVLAKADGR